MRKLFLLLRSKSPEFRIKYLTRKRQLLHKQLMKIENEIIKKLHPTIRFSLDVVYGIKSEPTKRTKLKTLCPDCFKSFSFEPSNEMKTGKNIAHNSCPHCKAELVSFASPDLTTGKNAVAWLKSEYKNNVEVMAKFIKDFSAKNGIQFYGNDKDLEKLNAYYKQILDSSNFNGLIN